MQVRQAQDDVSWSFVGGGPGAAYSGLIWIVAGFVFLWSGIGTSFIALFLGGVTIFPVSVLLSRMVFRRPALSPVNPLGMLGLESTIAMIGCMFGAWLLLPLESAYVMPLSAIAVGTHYFAFKTLYGNRLYWLLGALVTLVGFAGIYVPDLPSGSVMFAVGIVEIIFGVILSWRALKNIGPPASAG